MLASLEETLSLGPRRLSSWARSNGIAEMLGRWFGQHDHGPVEVTARAASIPHRPAVRMQGWTSFGTTNSLERASLGQSFDMSIDGRDQIRLSKGLRWHAATNGSAHGLHVIRNIESMHKRAALDARIAGFGMGAGEVFDSVNGYEFAEVHRHLKCIELPLGGALEVLDAIELVFARHRPSPGTPPWIMSESLVMLLHRESGHLLNLGVGVGPLYAGMHRDAFDKTTGGLWAARVLRS